MKLKKIHLILVGLFLTIASFSQGVADKDLNAYLFTYFLGNSPEEEAINFAVSHDGYNFFTLNENKPVLDSKQISSVGGVRDPHVITSIIFKFFQC